MHRRVISTGARMLARPLTTVSDPMSGFFGIHKKYVPYRFLFSPTKNSSIKPRTLILMGSKSPLTSFWNLPFPFKASQKSPSRSEHARKANPSSPEKWCWDILNNWVSCIGGGILDWSWSQRWFLLSVSQLLEYRSLSIGTNLDLWECWEAIEHGGFKGYLVDAANIRREENIY